MRTLAIKRSELRRALLAIYDNAYMNGYMDADRLNSNNPLSLPTQRKLRTASVNITMTRFTGLGSEWDHLRHKVKDK